MTQEEKAENTAIPGKKEAYFLLGSAAGLGLFLGGIACFAPLMPFALVPLITMGMIALPVGIDILRNGKNNILQKAWKGLKACWNVVKTDFSERKEQLRSRTSDGTTAGVTVPPAVKPPLTSQEMSTSFENSVRGENRPHRVQKPGTCHRGKNGCRPRD
ncbi:MAG: hypothetical protein EPN97_11550 [Alphaproteobacteria bacterium]|nr:MAG: hypothetical protein EPN97_11550 [Alphaproteobacteria bacterium]